MYKNEKMMQKPTWTKLFSKANIEIGGAVGASLLVTFAVPATLTLIGFGSSGVIVGSTAAAIQSSIGLVSSGSLFATCTSVGMAGVSTATTVAVAATGAAVGAKV